MKVLKTIAILALAVGLHAADNPAKAQLLADLKAVKSSVPSIAPADLMAMNKAGKDFILVDVRDPDEVALGKIDAEKWKHMSRGKVEFQAIKANGLPQDKMAVIYCAAGTRGALVTKMLMNYGYKNIKNLTGGVQGWVKAGYPLVNKLGTFKKVADSETGLEQIK